METNKPRGAQCAVCGDGIPNVGHPGIGQAALTVRVHHGRKLRNGRNVEPNALMVPGVYLCAVCVLAGEVPPAPSVLPYLTRGETARMVTR